MRVTWLLVVVLAVVVAGCGGKNGGASNPASPFGADDGTVVLTRDLVPDIMNDAGRYKGKTVRALLTLDSSIPVAGGDSLQKHAGQAVTFFMTGPNNEVLTLPVLMPGGNLPDAHDGDQLWVTFVCKEGRVRRGNEGVKVERP